MLTYHALGYYGLLGIPAALAAARLMPAGSPARRALARAALGALLLIAAIIALSY
ncbi:hypothetical protein Q5762_13885 [Streptomyces sp. P9(2023)]|uniref:hypothetical protein n=1 Tax=Streptomyces sp. P9(2023) TaxID=3064394 RepID=UPI0028F440E4|nr:hypothetical protein [Streptomyces sp. P9(2023)]MDT9689407.1 hypothetical protein [Streptomyces sp. P9(2023)]